MDDRKLEDTKEINNLEEIVQSENNSSEELKKSQNEILEINDEINSVDETIKEIDKLTDEVRNIKEKKKLKDRIKEKWTSFSKKKRIIIIVSSIIVFVLLLTLILVLVLKNDKKEDKKEEVKNVVLEADNYRYDNGKLIFIGKDKKELGEYACKNKDKDLCYVAYLSNTELYDTDKNINEDGTLIKQRSQIINDNYVFVFDNDKKDAKNIILYDIKNKKEMENYTGVSLASENYIIVSDTSESYGVVKIVDEKVTPVIDFNYDDIRYYNDADHKYFMVNENGRNYLMNESKKAISKAVSSSIINYNDKYLVAVSDDNKYFVYDYKANQVFESGCDYAKLFKDFVVIVDNNELFLRFYDKKKVTEQTFKINPKYKYYQKTYVFDEDKNLKEEYEPFAVVLNNTTITVTIDKKDTVINLKEAEISKNTDYINYFAGILYFYDDSDKTNLIGQYKCTNENALSASSTTFDSCFIASDTTKHDNDVETYNSTGLIPILNNRYVFIKDNPKAVSESNTTVVIYDLKDKKVIKKYLSVDTMINSNSSQPTFREASDLPIIVKDKSNKYGMLHINTNRELTPLIDFKYNMIEKIGNYYLTSESDGYTLYNKAGESVSSKFAGKVRGYNSKYVKTNENGSYYIYEINGSTKLNTTGYKYVELYDSYYAGVDHTNKLNIYKYDDANTALINGGVALSSTSYCKTDNPAFKITFAGTQAMINILTNNGKYDEGTTYSLVATQPSESGE